MHLHFLKKRCTKVRRAVFEVIKYEVLENTWRNGSNPGNLVPPGCATHDHREVGFFPFLVKTLLLIEVFWKDDGSVFVHPVEVLVGIHDIGRVNHQKVISKLS